MVLMLLGKLVSLFGSFIYSFTMGLYVLKVTGSAMSFAATLISGTLPRIILAPFAGALADRFDRKKIVVGMDLVSGVVMLILFGVTHFYGMQLRFIYGVAALLAAANTFLNVALDAAMPNMVTDRHLTRINSLSHSVVSLTQIAAPFIGGIIFGLANIRLFILINGISFIASAISELFISFRLTLPPQTERATTASSIFAQMKEGWVFLRGHAVLFSLGFFAVFLNFCAGIGLGVSVPYIINNVLGLSSTLYGIISALLPAGMLIGALTGAMCGPWSLSGRGGATPYKAWFGPGSSLPFWKNRSRSSWWKLDPAWLSSASFPSPAGGVWTRCRRLVLARRFVDTVPMYAG